MKFFLAGPGVCGNSQARKPAGHLRSERDNISNALGRQQFLCHLAKIMRRQAHPREDWEQTRLSVSADFNGVALIERMKGYGVASGVGVGVGVGVGAGATLKAASIAVGPSTCARPEAFSKLTRVARHEMVPPRVF